MMADPERCADSDSEDVSFLERPPSSAWDCGSSSPTPPLAQALTLEALLDSQTATGAFELSPQLQTALIAKFKPGMRKPIDNWPETVVKEDVKLRNVDELLDTAMPVVYIEKVFADDKRLWSLVVQKARVWLEGLIPVERHRERLLKILRKGLGDGCEDVETGEGEEKAGIFSMSEEEAREFLLPDEDPKQVSTGPQTKELVIGPYEGDLLVFLIVRRGKGGKILTDGMMLRKIMPEKGIEDLASEGNVEMKPVSKEKSQRIGKKATNSSISVEQNPFGSRSVRKILTNFLSFGKKK